MDAGPLHKTLEPLRQFAAAQALADCDTRQLLERFVAERNQDVFAELVRRHRKVVWGVCKNLLRHEQDAEDAFQATFLVLALKGRAIRKTQSLGSWLHGVAYRCAMQIKRQEARRQRRERKAADNTSRAPAQESNLRELAEVLATEVQNLPEKHRAPFILCCLQNKSQEEAARELGWKIGTVSGRLARARQELERRLRRQGIALSAALAAGALGASEVSGAVAAGTILAGSAILSGAVGLKAAVSPKVVALVKGACHAMLLSKVKSALFVLISVGLLAGLGFAAQQTIFQADGEKPKLAAGEKQKPAAPAPAPEPKRNENLRYDGKPFDYWRDYGTNELKPERRVDAIRAMGAFGVRGYGKEAAEVIVGLVKEYSVDDVYYQRGVKDVDLTPDQRVVKEAYSAIQKIGPPAGPVLLKDLSSENLRTFAVYAFRNDLVHMSDSLVPSLTKMIVEGTPEIRGAALEIISSDWGLEWTGSMGSSASRQAALFWNNAKKETKRAIHGLSDVVANTPRPAHGGIPAPMAAAAYLLGELGADAREAGPILAKAILEEQAPTREPQAHALGISRIQEAMLRTKPDAQIIVAIALKALKEGPGGKWDRVAAIQMLGALGAAAKPAVPELLAELSAEPAPSSEKSRNDNEESGPELTRRLQILDALDRIGPKRDQLLPVLTKILESKSQPLPLQAAAFRHLQKLKPHSESLVPALANYLDRAHASRGQFGMERQKETAKDMREIYAIFRDLGPKAQKAMPALLRIFNSEFRESPGPQSSKTLFEVVTTWAKMGDAARDALPSLYQYLADKSGGPNAAVLRAAANDAIKAISKVAP